MNWRNLLWWVFCSAGSVILQSCFPGLDFMLPFFLLAIQERKLIQTICTGIWFVLLQEGMGSFAFGGTAVLYSFAVILFFSGSRLFQGKNFLYVVFLGIVLAWVHYALYAMLCSLQNFPFRHELLTAECVCQMFVTPFVWWIANSLRRMVKNEA
jgi:hypothetical protein